MDLTLLSWLGYNPALFQVFHAVRDARLNLFMQLAEVLGNPLYAPLYAGVLLATALFQVAGHARRLEWSVVTRWAVAFIAFSGSCLLYAAVLPLFQLLWSACIGQGRTGAVRALHDVAAARGAISVHAAFAMTLLVSLWRLLALHQKIAGGLFVLWVGVSRIYAGAHFAPDVAMGWGSALLVVIVLRHLAGMAVPHLVDAWAGWLARRARLR
jgi:membrane-associated phospholipid phosphatase